MHSLQILPRETIYYEASILATFMLTTSLTLQGRSLCNLTEADSVKFVRDGLCARLVTSVPGGGQSKPKAH